MLTFTEEMLFSEGQAQLALAAQKGNLTPNKTREIWAKTTELILVNRGHEKGRGFANLSPDQQDLVGGEEFSLSGFLRTFWQVQSQIAAAKREQHR